MGALNILAKAGKTAAKSDEALPLMLGRATPKTQAEIDALATRVARQMNEEHVRAPNKTSNLAGKSLKESQRLKGLNYAIKPTGAAQPSVVYQPKKGDVNVALPGDQTISDAILQSVGDIEGINSTQQGGALYGLGKLKMKDPLFWASNEGPAQLFQNKVNRVADFYDPERVVGQHLAMGPISNNFAMHFADANLRAMDLSKMSPKQMQTFDSLIAHGYYKKNAKTGAVEHIKFDDWPGIADPEGALIAMRNNSELRKWFNNRMKTPDVTQPLGLPNGRDIEWAITQPELRNMEVNLTGLSAGEMVPGASLTDTAAHNTYSKGIRGTALGHQEVLTPFTLSFPDAAQHIASTQRPQDFTGTIQKVFPHQIVDEQYLDEMGRYRDLIKKYTGKKKGGLTLKASGGLIKAQLKALREEFAAKDAVIKAQQAIDEKKYLKDIQPNTLTPENIQKKVEETKPQKFDEGGAAFGKFPQMSLKRRKQDPEAAKNVPVDVVRGFVAGMLGAPSDVANIPSDIYEAVTGKEGYKVPYGSEHWKKTLPLQPTSAVGKAAQELGNVAGGFYTGPGSPFKLIGVLPAAVKHGAEEFAKASAMGAPHVIKKEGGNWLGGNMMGNIDRSLKRLTPTKNLSYDIKTMKAELASLENSGANQRTIDLLKADIAEAEKDQAIYNWTTRNLGNYVKKEMGTPSDPVRRLADQGIVHAPHGEFVDPEAPSLWSKRNMAGFPNEGMAKSTEAANWEDLSDRAINYIRAGDVQRAVSNEAKGSAARKAIEAFEAELPAKFEEYLQRIADVVGPEGVERMRASSNSRKADMLGQGDMYRQLISDENMSKLGGKDRVRMLDTAEENPWIEKLPQDERLYSGDVSELGFDHIIDVLRQDVREGRIRPEQLSKVSMEQAVRRTHEYDQEMAKKLGSESIKDFEVFPTHKEYPEGYRWIELKRPDQRPEGWETSSTEGMWTDPTGKLVKDPNVSRLEQALKFEGESMGHCVGGYCPDVLSGQSRIYSLRDPKGQPHVTVEVNPRQIRTWDDVTAAVGKDEAAKLWNEFDQIGGNNMDNTDAAFDMFIKQKGIQPTQSIRQIKGKQNAAPKEAYLPYVQDFVRSGDWSSVGDLSGTGLRDIEKTPHLKKWLHERGVEHPRYMTEKEYGAHEADFLLDRLKPEGQKRGGMITSLKRNNRSETASKPNRLHDACECQK